MAHFGDTLRGDGLARAQRALVGLEEDPQRLDHTRIRFEDSPPPYTSDRSGTTTRSQSPNPPNEEQRLCQERRMHLAWERDASQPRKQFAAQTSDEEKRIFEASLNGTCRLPVGSNISEIAYDNVKKCWVDQGIWNSKWNQFASGRWKHEEPLELESGSGTDSETEFSRPLFSLFLKEPKPRRLKSDKAKRQIEERRVIREREREASRPYHQFVYQISNERERIQYQLRSVEGGGMSNADINTTAYQNVKNTWTKRGIWNERWGILPGMLWKHEEPLEDEPGDGNNPQTNRVENNSHEMDRASPRNHVGCPVLNLSESGIFIRNPSPAESNHHQESVAMNASQQGPTTDLDSAGLEICDTERPPPPPNLPGLQTGSAAKQAAQPSRKKPSKKELQLHPVSSVSLGPIHSSKVSKGTKKRSRPQRRSHISENGSPSDLLLSSSISTVEVPSLPTREAPRRSSRIQRLVPSVAKDPNKTISTDSFKHAALSIPKRNVATRSSAKPRGISKNQRAKTKREKVRKE
jgi:hypothetical protein